MWMHSSTYGIPIGINQRSDSYTTFRSGSCINKRLYIYSIKEDYVLFSLSVQRMSYYDNSLSTAHTKMGGPTFIKEKVVKILEKKYYSAEL